MKVKIIKRSERQTVSAANSGESHEPKKPSGEKSISKAVKTWIAELRQKSESDARYLESCLRRKTVLQNVAPLENKSCNKIF